ncbi:efflux transporter outer membrane subunit [Mucilaginibacter conchicola]|uniref:Efflux transporter outer membrane subunit n=1 Tax=Mucilaginibacter conchicola TaxID=2303333 RepID=A0A372NQD2_9SPHI|nr:efflux transporter outer membrane subunit [Mucilaginibacter conchicola]RFZ91141.1 efflux transporter outer membrane subunit [Mucilaginibacter conchicola]
MKTRYLKIILPVLLAAMQSCRVSQDVKLPDMHLPESYRTASEGDTTVIAKLPWRSFFSDPELQSLIDSAVSRNYDLGLALKNLEIARLNFIQSKQGNLPEAGLAISASSNRPSNNSLNGLTYGQFLGTKHVEDYTAAVDISWEADIWGKIRSRKEASLADYLQSEEARKTLQTKIVSMVSQNYYQLLMLDTQLEIARKNLALSDNTLKMIRLQYDAGQVTAMAIQQAEAQRLTAAALIPRFEQEISITENSLSVLCGKLPEAISRQQTLDKVNRQENLSAGVPLELLSIRPDVRAAEIGVDRANAEVGYSKARMYPSLTITAEGGLNAFRASNWFRLPASLFGAVAGGITQPVFQRKALRTRYEISKAEREKSIIQFRQQVLTAVQEVSDALIRIRKLDRQQDVLREKVTSLRLATANANLLFKNGKATYLEVIIAQSGVLQSELDLAGIEKAGLDARIDLYRSVGGGWH